MKNIVTTTQNFIFYFNSENIKYLNKHYIDFKNKCESNSEAYKEIKSGHKYTKILNPWQFERYVCSQ